MSANLLIWLITALATAGVVLRPFQWPEALWVLAGAALMVVLQLLSPREAWVGFSKGIDVYLFLTGMMLLSEIAREEGFFDWLATIAVRHARGSGTRLFLLIYGVGTLVTVFLSNDATAIVLTPAVAIAVKTAKVRNPLPYLFICAFIANAASFVLPISNPANLVLYNNHVPSLQHWLPHYLLPSVFSIFVTYIVLRWAQRKDLQQGVAGDIEVQKLSRGGKAAALGIAATALALLGCSALDIQLGFPTFIAGAITALCVVVLERKAPWRFLEGISWPILPLVAGLFVLAEGLGKSGIIHALSVMVQEKFRQAPDATAWGLGAGLAFLCNLTNNLPAGLIAGDVSRMAHLNDQVKSAILIGVDLGPNLSVTGSLATILWLTALRREGYKVTAWDFLKLGILVMPLALVPAIGASFFFNH